VAEEEESIILGVLKNAASGVLASWPFLRIATYSPHIQQWLPIREATDNSQPCWMSLFEYFLLSLVLVSITHMLMKRANIWIIQQSHIGSTLVTVLKNFGGQKKNSIRWVSLFLV